MRISYLTLVMFLWPLSLHAEILQLDYDGFSVWLDCERQGATKFHYIANEDSGSYKRRSKFVLDPGVPERCQQSSSNSYKRPKGEIQYDRGHLVPANHLDGSKQAIKQSNFMTNILPQVANMNRGAWLQTEEIIECYRDLEPLEVWGGVIWGSDPADDYFLASHGLRTPDAFWKVIVRGDRGIAWVIPNSPDAKRKALDNYLVAIDRIEEISGVTFDLPADQKSERLSASWVIPFGCDKG